MEKVAACLSLMRRLPPNNVQQNLSGLLNLVPEETDELLQRIDQPLEISVDSETGRNFLLCDYNRDGDSHRSPWSNKYFPSIEDGFLPSERIRAMEVEANELFDCYREQYFEGGVSSVYLWDLDHGFAGCFLIKKNVDGERFVKTGSWDSLHVVEVIEESSTKATYKLTTTVIVSMSVVAAEVGNTELCGSLTRQMELSSAPVNEVKTHIANIGRLIEDMEYDIRNHLNEIYVLKTRHVVNSIRAGATPAPKQNANHISFLNTAVLSHGKKRDTTE